MSRVPSRRHGPTRIEQDLDTLGRLASLEHLMNQHDILLDALMRMLEKGMEESSTTKRTTSNGGYSREERKV